MYRKGVVKGYFYPAEKAVLEKLFEDWRHDDGEKEAKMVVVPHAGYIYSGKTAFKTLSSVKIPNNILLFGPNHTGFGNSVSVYPKGKWETPFGDIDIDGEMVDALQGEGFITDTLAHTREHSLEVQLPMIKYLKSDAVVTPITFMHIGYEDCVVVAKRIFSAIKKVNKEFLVVVSSDFNHFEDENITNKKDAIAIEQILELNPEGLYEKVVKNSISMCGVIPCTVGLLIAKMLGCVSAVLVEHTTSANVTGDYNNVVGYAGIIIN